VTAARSRRSGQALVEFALVFPILILLVVGLFDLGRLVFAYTSLTNGVREGARLAVVNQDVGAIQDRVRGQVFAVSPTVTVTFKKPGPNADPETNPACSPITIGCIAVVRGSTTVAPITPIVGALVGAIAMNAVSQIPVEFVCPNPSIPAYQSTSSCPRQP
jgi:hypothetical protein